MDIGAFIDGLPKAELHLPIEGTLEPEMMLAPGRRNGVELPYTSVEEVRAVYEFGCRQDFLDPYCNGMSVLVTERDFHDLTWAYLEKVHGQGVRHAEIFFDPQGRTGRGWPLKRCWTEYRRRWNRDNANWVSRRS